jgi:hypothetical protein
MFCCPTARATVQVAGPRLPHDIMHGRNGAAPGGWQRMTRLSPVSWALLQRLQGGNPLMHCNQQTAPRPANGSLIGVSRYAAVW